MAETLKTLVVDDEQVILDSARRILTSEHFRVLTAPDAESALQILETEAPDIVITDLMLPGASGIEFLETASEQDPTLLTIITTGYSTVENAVAALKRGAFDFLPKPFTFNELISSVCRASRAIELRLPLRGRVRPGEHGGDFYLGAQTWARLEEAGSALLGVTDFELQTIAGVSRFEFPDVGAEVQQGGRLLRLHTEDAMVHNVWAPLSGQVLACNHELRDETLRKEPQGAGWLVRILPSSAERELENLTR